MTGCVAKAVPLCADADGCWLTASLLATPAETSIGFDVVVLELPERKPSLRCPVLPVIRRFENFAVPLASVVAVVVPLSDPWPLAMDT